ncbi:hypothetical protein, variant [Aphanomyces invadans]|uniref:Uncharacterized protein n=1 Tax=Aphanomyces invadans TaxID=157072 RepID=A0A024U579_9STRA|nr:hypothetical protein, variant [Aphanomyces invadans]ETW01566.1 hypothetical protein, variant [Aphanomyces invadans]|eukprot:XP_008869414.1 hypothetical protein, variant [Aphanomyces invadans]
MAPTKTAIVQAKIRHELRHLHENHEVPEDIQRMAAMILDLMHKLAHNTIAVADVVDAEHRMESFLTANSKSKHIAVFESAMLEMTRAVVVTALQESLHALLSFGAFVPAALRFWKRQLKNPLELFLLTLPDKVFVLPGGDISTDEKIRVLDETYETLLVHIGELKLQLLKWPHTESKRNQDMMQASQALLLKVFSTEHLIRPNAVTANVLENASPTPASVSSGRARFSVKVILDFVEGLPNLRTAYKVELDHVLSGCTIPPFLRRRWWHVSVGAVGASLGLVYLVRNRHELGQLAHTMHKGIRDFVVDHMVVPINNIVGEILLSKKALIQDPLALKDSKESLQRMLADFIHDTNPSMPLAQQQAMVANMDMSVVSLQYEKELPKAVRNLVTGDIVRMMLIQIQFIKKELMVAMKAIDELMDANQLNMQMMATLPMFVVAGGIYVVISKTSRLLYQFTSSAMYEDPKSVASQMRYALRDIERLLNMQNVNGTIDADALPGLNSQVSTSSMSPRMS